MGVKQLIDYYVKPLIEDRYRGITQWKDFGDQTMRTGAEADVTMSAAGVIEKELNTVFFPGPTGRTPQIIAEALRQLCDEEVVVMPKLCISIHEGVLHRALRGGWHYTKDPSGKVIKDTPLKDVHSHPGDAFGNAVARLFGRASIPLGRWIRTRCVLKTALPQYHDDLRSLILGQLRKSILTKSFVLSLTYP